MCVQKEAASRICHLQFFVEPLAMLFFAWVFRRAAPYTLATIAAQSRQFSISSYTDRKCAHTPQHSFSYSAPFSISLLNIVWLLPLARANVTARKRTAEIKKEWKFESDGDVYTKELNVFNDSALASHRVVEVAF